MNGAEDSTYSTEVPSFKEIGTHTVDYKITSTNYEDLTGTFDVQVQKMDLANAYVGFTNTPQIYNGSAIDPGVTVKGTETSTEQYRRLSILLRTGVRRTQQGTQ